MYRNVFLLIFSIMLITACQKKSMDKFDMVNKWQTTYLKVEMPTANKSDSLKVVEDRFDHNPERIAQSQYFMDGTFSAWFLTKEGKQVDRTTGKWSMKKDSLFVDFVYGWKTVTVGYKIIPIENGFKGISKYDWDNDGEYDDLLTMKTKMIKN